MTFEGVGAPNPDFGPADSASAKNQIASGDGRVKTWIAPAKYRVTLSRGPEYALSSFEVDVRPGSHVDACDIAERCLLKRVVDTTGWLACDFHQHTSIGMDAPVGARDRITSNAAEGVEIALASEHNMLVDHSAVVRELGLADRVVEIVGQELTSDASKVPWGHANVFPLVPRADAARGGAIVVRDRAAKDILAEVRTQHADAVILINHPRSGNNGYFDLLDFDRTTGTSTNASYDPRFDAIELWNGRNIAQRTAVTEDVLALLRTSHPVTITGNSDTHVTVGQEAGYPRTYVKVKNDRDLATWSASRTAEITHALRETREVMVTNGPFIDVKAGGATIGGIARATSGKLVVNVTVRSAPWIDVKRITLLRASGEKLEKLVTQQPSTSGALVATAQFDLAVKTDDAFIVTAAGDKTLEPVLAGDAADIRPYALAGAIWIDADADGKSLAR